MIRRRDLLIAIGAGALAMPFGSYAQQTAKVPRIGAIIALKNLQRRDAFREGLREHGWIEGKNIIVEYRSPDGRPEEFAEFAREFISLKVDCIVASGNLAISALKQATSSIPIVMAFAADAVGSKFIVSLSRPGGNITGLTNIAEVLTPKRLELLKALNPGLSSVAVLRNPTIGAHNTMWKETQSAAQSLGLKVVAADYRGAEDFEAAFALIARERVDGLLVPTSPVVFSQNARIVGFAARQRLPSIYQNSMFVEAGGLMSYGADENDLWRRSTRYVDRILRGAKRAELPVEQPTKFELVINGKTARALGLAIPQSLLTSADRVIE